MGGELYGTFVPQARRRLIFRRVIGTALRAADQEPVHLMLVSVEQDRPAAAAGVVHRMVAGLENRRCVQNMPGCGRDDHFKTDLAGHREFTKGNAAVLSRMTRTSK